MPNQKVNFKTSDGVIIYGNFYNAGPESIHVLLLHMLPETKESWNVLAKRLQEKNISSLAIDLRGHGESTKIDEGTLAYTDFEEAEHQQSIMDIQSSLEWLEKERGIKKEKVAIVGASIGANLALQALSLYEDIPTAVILSPGLNYHGIETEKFVSSLKITQSILYVVSKDDSYSYNSVLKLYEDTNTEKDLIVYEGAGHGTYMFDSQPKLYEKIIDWLELKM